MARVKRAAEAGARFAAGGECPRAEHDAGTMWSNVCIHELADFERKAVVRTRDTVMRAVREGINAACTAMPHATKELLRALKMIEERRRRRG